MSYSRPEPSGAWQCTGTEEKPCSHINNGDRASCVRCGKNKPISAVVSGAVDAATELVTGAVENLSRFAQKKLRAKERNKKKKGQ